MSEEIILEMHGLPQCLVSSLRTELLRLAVPLVKTHGFTREALAYSALQLPQPHKEPLSEAAVTAIFGGGDDARRTLINAWMEAAVLNMRSKSSPPELLELLESRLKWNEPVLEKLPEVRSVNFVVAYD